MVVWVSVVVDVSSACVPATHCRQSCVVPISLDEGDVLRPLTNKNSHFVKCVDFYDFSLQSFKHQVSASDYKTFSKVDSNL